MALDFGLLGGQGLNPLKMATEGYATGLKAYQDEQNLLLKQQEQLAEQEAAAQQQAMLDRALSGDLQAQSAIALQSAKNSGDALKAFELMDKPKKEAARKIAYTMESLARSNQPELFRTEVQKQIDAYNNTDGLTPEQQADRDYYKSLLMMPENAWPLFTGQMIAAVDGQDAYAKHIEALTKSGTMPYDVAKAKASAIREGGEAQKAVAEGQYAPTIKQAELEEKRATTQLRVAEAALKRLESSGYMTPEQQLKAQKLRLEIGELESKKAQSVADKQNAYDSAVADFDSTLDTLYTLKNHKGMADALGPLDAKVPSLMAETVDFERQLEKLQSQQFLTAVAKVGSMAGLTEVEGKKLQSAIGALDIRMQPATFKRELNRVVTRIEEMKAMAAKKYGQKPANKNEVSSRSQAYDVLKSQYPDASEEQINMFLDQKGL